MQPGNENKNDQTAENKVTVKDDRDIEIQKAQEAHESATEDIDEDADLSIHSPNDDLDEGETARLGEDVTDII